MFGSFYFMGGIFLVLGCFGLMAQNRRKTSVLWAIILPISIFVGAAPFVALGYFFVYAGSPNNDAPNQQPLVNNTNAVTYHPDGSYTVYQAVGTPGASTAPSTLQVALKVIGTAISAISVIFGLLVVAAILMLVLTPATSSSGSKSY